LIDLSTYSIDPLLIVAHLFIFSSTIALQFRTLKYLNLSLGSFYTLGAYSMFFAFEYMENATLTHALALSTAASVVLSSILFILTQKIGRETVGRTIIALGYGIALEEAFRLWYRTSYFLTITTDIPLLFWEQLRIALFVAFIIILALFYLSPKGLKIKFIEEDAELAELYGVNTSLYSFFLLLTSTIFVTLLGAISSVSSAIFPSMGWGPLVSGIVVYGIASQLGGVGMRVQLNVLVVAAILGIAFVMGGGI
jgi:branched-chain amino acid transport system permease protein